MPKLLSLDQLALHYNEVKKIFATKRDISNANYLSKNTTDYTSLVNLKTSKQDKLVAGENIAINGTTISATSDVTKAYVDEQIATQSSENVKQNDDIALLNRKVSALEQLNEGVSYRFETDSTEAYSKVVPTGAKAFDLKLLGGKSVVANQIFTNVAPITSNNVFAFRKGARFVQGHKYYMGGECVKNNDSANCYFYIFTILETGSSATSFAQIGIGSFAKQKVIFTSPYTITSDGTNTNRAGNVWVYTSIGEGNSISNVRVVDLTVMFGAGNEPNTVEEFEALVNVKELSSLDPTIISASVENVKVVGSNLFNISEWADIKNGSSGSGVGGGARLSRLDINSNNSSVIITSNGSDAYTFYSNTNGYFPQNAKIYGKKGDKFTVSADVESSNANGSIYVFEEGLTNNFAQKVYYYANGKVPISVTITLTKDTYITWRFGVTNANGTVKYSNIRINKGDVALPYAPYKPVQNITIPNECLDLKSALNVNDFCELFEQDSKKYIRKIQRIGSIDLGTLPFREWGDGLTDVFYCNTDIGAKRSTTLNNCICKLYDSAKNIDSNTKDKSIVLNTTSHSVNIIAIKDNNYTDVNTFKQAMQGVMLYYELATPIETIYEIDNRFEAIQCEANGTITFEGANENYHLPVPNTEEFVVKLSEV